MHLSGANLWLFLLSKRSDLEKRYSLLIVNYYYCQLDFDTDLVNDYV